MFAIVETCHLWKYYMKSANHYIALIIDHVNLQRLLRDKFLNC